MGLPTDPAETYLIEPFGTTAGREIPHTGDDWARRRVDGKVIAETPRIMACFSGTVIYAGWRGVAGNLVIIRYWFGRIGGYSHLSQIRTKLNATVSEGETIGLLGGTGKTTGPHLHYSQHTEAGLDRLLKGIYPYWKNAKTGKVLWSSVDAWANNSGLLKPDYSIGSKASAQATPAQPAKTAEQIEEEELMALSDETLEQLASMVRREIAAEARLIESRVRREVRPEVYFIAEGADGTRYTIDDSPAAVAMQPASGFILPLNPADEGGRGQVRSLKTNYRLIGHDSNPVGQTEHVFWNNIKDVARGAGIIDRGTDEASGVAWARSLFGK